MPFWLKHCSGFLEPKLIENPPTHTKVRGHGCGARQTAAAIKEDVAKLQKPLAAILVGKEISWVIQAALGASGYVTVEDLADRWNTPAAARDNGPRDLGFQDGENGFNAQTSAFTAMRLLQAVRVAANLVRGGNQGDHPATKAPLEVLCDRRQLEDAYVATHGAPKPRLEFQGGDGYLKKQWRMIAKGELGYIPAKHIVSALPPTRRSRWTAGTGRMKKR